MRYIFELTVNFVTADTDFRICQFSNSDFQCPCLIFDFTFLVCVQFFNIFVCFFPKQCLHYRGSGALIRLVKVSPRFRASETVQNVAKTIGFTTFTNKKLLWLENGGPPITLAAATAHLFSPTLIKPMKYQHFFDKSPFCL